MVAQRKSGVKELTVRVVYVTRTFWLWLLGANFIVLDLTQKLFHVMLRARIGELARSASLVGEQVVTTWGKGNREGIMPSHEMPLENAQEATRPPEVVRFGWCPEPQVKEPQPEIGKTHGYIGGEPQLDSSPGQGYVEANGHCHAARYQKAQERQVRVTPAMRLSRAVLPPAPVLLGVRHSLFWRIGRWVLHGAVALCVVVVALGQGFWPHVLPARVTGGTDQIAALWNASSSVQPVSLTNVASLGVTDIRSGYLATGGLAVKPDRLVLNTYVTSAGETIYDVAQITRRSVDTLLWANNLVDPGAPLPSGMQLRIPPTDGMLHVVREGDTLDAIAARYGVTPDVITGYEPNGVQRDTDLVPGQLLMVPGGKMPSRDHVVMYTVQEGDTLWKIAERFGLKVQTITWANSLPDPELIYPGQQLAILPTDGVMVKVKEGDTIESLAEYWGVKPEDIRDYPLNGIGPNGILRVGQLVMIPGGEPPPPPPAPAATPVQSGPPAQRQAPRGSIIWPTTGVITQYFHARHNGWDIANSMYTPIVAADSGTVIFSGWNNYGLGYAVAIDHGNGFVTWYGHMAEPPPVQVGQWVNRGQYIGPMGSTGYSTGPHVHFIIMYNGVYQDPALYLR